MNAIGYIRLSDQDQSNYSIDSQERQIKEYCSRNNLTLLKVYIDNGESSYTFDRKAFGDLEREMKKAKYLIVYHLDRFSRNMSEAMIKIKHYLEKGIKVRDVSESLDMDDYDINTFMLRSMKFMVAESELHRIRQRTKSGLIQAAMNGRFTSTAPTGYKNARDEHNKPVLRIDEEKAFVIRLIFREYLNGMGIEEVRRMISRYEIKAKGNSTIQRILANPVYAGFIRVPATKAKPAHLVKGLHDAIIHEQDYWLVQDRLTGKKIVTQNSEEVPLRGVLHCGCGKVMTAGNSKGRSKYYWYYVCPDCKTSLSASKLHDQLARLLENLSIEGDKLKAVRILLKNRLQLYIKDRTEKIAQVNKQLKLVEEKIGSVEEKYLLKPDLSEATYNKVIGALRADQSRLYKELSKLNINHQVYWEKMNDILGGMADMKARFEKMPVQKKQQFITWVFDNSLHHDNGIYRTTSLPEFLLSNLKVLKEKGLLELVAPVRNFGETPRGTGGGNSIEPQRDILTDLDKLILFFAA